MAYNIPKYLSPEIKKITKELIKRKIETRFNIVVTKQNIEEINELIEKSFSLGVNIKILDLIIRDDYYGIKHQITGEEALKFGKRFVCIIRRSNFIFRKNFRQ